MNAVILMLLVTVCYTITSLSDKYAVAEAKFTGDEFTFLMCSSMSVFLALSLPFQKLYFSLTWQSFATVVPIITRYQHKQMPILRCKKMQKSSYRIR